jgi:hypothetical protein
MGQCPRAETGVASLALMATVTWHLGLAALTDALTIMLACDCERDPASVLSREFLVACPGRRIARFASTPRVALKWRRFAKLAIGAFHSWIIYSFRVVAARCEF